MSKLLEFEKLHNTRDLGGMRTRDGRVIREGRLFRSGHLSDLIPGDAAVLSGLIDRAVDLRTATERDRQPDQPMEGVENVHIPIMESLTSGITREKEADRNAFTRFRGKPEEAKRYMCEVYRSFAGDFAVKQYSNFIKLLAGKESRTLWHCTAGKDRAGIASVLIEEILGVPREAIVEDYLKTNEYIKDDVQFLTEFVNMQSGTDSSAEDMSLKYLFGAEEDYIRSFYETVDEKYGSFENFVREGLEISRELEERLREKYLKEAEGASVHRLRQAAGEDIPRILELLVQVDMVHHRGRPDLFKGPATKYNAEELKGILADSMTPVFVCADETGQVLGHAFCIHKQFIGNSVMTDVKTLYIDDICVDEAARGRGVGQALYKHVLDYAKEKGCYNVTLNVWSCNPVAMAFYEKMGLVPQKIGMEKIL